MILAWNTILNAQLNVLPEILGFTLGYIALGMVLLYTLCVLWQTLFGSNAYVSEDIPEE